MVTGKKIISLKSVKGKASDEEEKLKIRSDNVKTKIDPPKPRVEKSESKSENNNKTVDLTLDEPKSNSTQVMAPLRPIRASIRPMFDDIDEEMERKLLEEESTTPPPPIVPVVAPIVIPQTTTTSSNRRVIIKPKEIDSDHDEKRKVDEGKKNDENSQHTRGKRIFERLERKGTIGNDSKRKMQRIVVSNVD